MNLLIPFLWRKLRWALPFLAALLPIILLSVFSFRVASGSVQKLVESGNMSATTNLSQLVTQDFTQTVSLAHAIASVPGTVTAVRARDSEAIGVRLKAIVLAYPQIDRVFVTDSRGTLWSDYPPQPGAFGKTLSDTDWYAGVSQRWKPYVSGVYVRSSGSAQPVIAIAVPVTEKGGDVIGALVFEYQTTQIRRWLSNIRLGNNGHLFLLDQHNTVIAHPLLPEDDPVLYQGYRDLAVIGAARSEGIGTHEYVDPVGNQQMIATFQPLAVGSNMWMVVAQQPVSEAYAVLNDVKLNIRLAGLVLTLITLGMVVALARMSSKNERLNRQLNEKNKTLQDITSFVSHQLRAPVTAMRWTIESIIDGDEGDASEGVKTSLASLRDIAIQNGKLIDDILNVSRIDRGVIEVVTEKVALTDIAERALRDYRMALQKAGLSLTTEGFDQPVIVHADKEKMAEAVTNAISNAIKHTKQGGITVRLRHDDAYGYIDVIDTGEGMTPEIMGKLFDRAGVSGSNTDSGRSTGLGLYIARNFMRLQGGDITVMSEPGKGSTFTYRIPLTRGTRASH